MANKDYSAWLESTLKYSEDVSNMIGEKTLDDTFGWGERLSFLAAQAAGERPSGVLLCGPDGCGKHTAASFIVRELTEGGYLAVFPDFSSVAENCSDASDLTGRLDALLDRAYDDGVGLCLVIETDGEFRFCRDFFNYLGVTSFKYDLNGDELPGLFIILIDGGNTPAGPILSRRLLRCRMSLPSLGQRLEFLNRFGAGIRKVVSIENLAAGTEGFSYAALTDAVTILTLIADQTGKSVPNDEVNAILDSQREFDFEEGAAVSDGPVGKPLVDVQEKIAGLIEKRLVVAKQIEKRISELKGKIGTGIAVSADPFLNVQAPSEQPETSDTPKAVNYADELKSTQSMPVRKLAVELWGEENVIMLMEE